MFRDAPLARACAECARDLPIAHFPKKGAGRYESRCKACHNAGKREKRKGNAAPEWQVSELPVRENWMEGESGNFLDALYLTMKSLGYFGKRAGPESVEEILKRKSGVNTLLGLDGKL